VSIRNPNTVPKSVKAVRPIPAIYGGKNLWKVKIYNSVYSMILSMN